MSYCFNSESLYSSEYWIINVRTKHATNIIHCSNLQMGGHNFYVMGGYNLCILRTTFMYSIVNHAKKSVSYYFPGTYLEDNW